MKTLLAVTLISLSLICTTTTGWTDTTKVYIQKESLPADGMIPPSGVEIKILDETGKESDAFIGPIGPGACILMLAHEAQQVSGDYQSVYLGFPSESTNNPKIFMTDKNGNLNEISYKVVGKDVIISTP